jgi:recombination protein RecR
MSIYPQSIQKLIERFSRFPTVGPRTAARFVFYLIEESRQEAEELASLILMLKEKIKLCPLCFNPFEPSTTSADQEEKLCRICRNPSRDKTLLCIVEKEIDLNALEATKKYNGLYFILGGTVSRMKTQKKEKSIKKLRIEELLKRAENPEIKEIIIATNPTTEGEATALYLERLLENLPQSCQITRLGRGLPVGGELEYADEETISSALEGRK